MSVTAYKHLGNFLVVEPFVIFNEKVRLEYNKGAKLAKLKEDETDKVVWFDPISMALIPEHPIFEENCSIGKWD